MQSSGETNTVLLPRFISLSVDREYLVSTIDMLLEYVLRFSVFKE